MTVKISAGVVMGSLVTRNHCPGFSPSGGFCSNPRMTLTVIVEGRALEAQLPFLNFTSEAVTDSFAVRYSRAGLICAAFLKMDAVLRVSSTSRSQMISLVDI